MKERIRVFALGGLDERGKNMYIIEIGEDIFVIEAGIKYPIKSMPGIDFILPDSKYLIENKDRVKAYIISNARNENMAALPFIIKQVPAPVYTSEVTKYFICDCAKRFFVDIKNVDWRIVDLNSSTEINGHKISFYSLTQPSPLAFGVVIHTSQGNIVYSSDFIFDFGAPTDFTCNLPFISKLAKEKTLLLMCESLEMENQGHSSPNHRFTPHIEQYFLEDCRIIITQYTQNLYGIREIIELAKKYNRKILFYSREMQLIINDLTKAKIIDIPKDLLVNYDYLLNKKHDVVIIMTGGGQRIFREIYKIGDGNKEKNMIIDPSDRFIIATPPSSGLETYAATAIDMVYRSGAKVVNLTRKKIATLNAHSEDVKMLMSIFQPKFYMPIKGEYRQLLANANMIYTKLEGFNHNNIFVYDNGMIATFIDGKKSDEVQLIDLQEVLVDGLGVGDVGNSVLQDRQKLSDSGVVVLGISINTKTKQIIAGPDIQMRGLIFLKDGDELVKELAAILVEICNEYLNKHLDVKEVKVRLREKASLKIKKFTGKEPIIIPAIIDLAY